eukprot:Plantae.Rhodophyta-Palmaria_palmata.ctg25977.p1 GENE.Plantae.Rhodophyta-Palmaria_palmata.ctg25977~~Plantae.Rhodophyta-Palmaria_palmata.ctg25977.p1  ORF type:complete len:258 (+),score=35.94 Plantae.Rhodophyta-Palmaria_palmata.ctg25977:109-774(+)
MANDTIFSTGNHPQEMFVPMLHFRDAGFTFDIATASGDPVALEMWAYPSADKAVAEFHDTIKELMTAPKALRDIPNLDAYAAVFIPGGHGAMINLPQSAHLGRLLREAHGKLMPTVTLCHGPAALLASGVEGDFAYDGYEAMCFTDRTDGYTPMFGYLPGKMPWRCQEAIAKKGINVLNTKENGAVHRHRELITGDSPMAADAIGKLAAPIVVKFAMEGEI